jgi:HEAT repeat protein
VDPQARSAPSQPALTGLDDVDWARLTHAYGSAEDVPATLRALGSDDSEAASEALSELFGSIFHQGTVYEATVPAVRFLVDLGYAAPHGRADIVGMVGMLADPNHAYGGLDEVDRAVAAQAERLVPLLADTDARVRAQAAYALAQCGARTPVAALRDRWAVETEPEVRASLLLALALRDPDGTAPLLRDAMVDPAHEVRVAAAIGALRAGTGWPDGAAEALAEAFTSGVELDYSWQSGGEALDELLTNVDDEFAASLIGPLLAASEPDARRAALWALGERCSERRSAPARFVPLVGPLLDDPDPEVRRRAFGVLRKAGEPAGQFADVLARTAAKFAETDGTVEYIALATLIHLGDPRWFDAVAAAWREGHELYVNDLWPPFNAAVLDALRRYLAEPEPEPDVVAGIVDLIGVWGSDAAPAAPELLAALPAAPTSVAYGFVSLGGEIPAAVLPHVRDEALTGDVRSGVAVWRQTGDAEPLLAAVGKWFDEGSEILGWYLSHAIPAGAVLGPFVPRLREYLTGEAMKTPNDQDLQAAAAHLVWLSTGDAEAVRPTAEAVLAAGGRSTVSAARLLWQLGTPPDELAPAVLGVTRYGHAVFDAIALLVEMRATSAVPDLVRLAERDEPVSTGGNADDTVWNDERVRRELRTAVDALTAGA